MNPENEPAQQLKRWHLRVLEACVEAAISRKSSYSKNSILTAAAQCLGYTSPGLEKALAKLREAFKDDLIVFENGGQIKVTDKGRSALVRFRQLAADFDSLEFDLTVDTRFELLFTPLMDLSRTHCQNYRNAAEGFKIAPRYFTSNASVVARLLSTNNVLAVVLEDAEISNLKPIRKLGSFELNAVAVDLNENNLRSSEDLTLPEFVDSQVVSMIPVPAEYSISTLERRKQLSRIHSVRSFEELALMLKQHQELIGLIPKSFVVRADEAGFGKRTLCEALARSFAMKFVILGGRFHNDSAAKSVFEAVAQQLNAIEKVKVKMETWVSGSLPRSDQDDLL